MPWKGERLKFGWPKALWLLFLLGLLWWALRLVSFRGLWQVLDNLRPTQLAILAALNLFILGLFTLRWGIILRAHNQQVSLWALFRYRLAAFGLNYFTPGPQFGGEPLQVLLLREKHGLPVHKAVSGVSLDKMMELLANFGFLMVGVLVSVRMGIDLGLAETHAASLAIGLLLLPGGYLGIVWAGHTPLAHIARWLALSATSGGRWGRAAEAVAAVELQVKQVLKDRPQAVFAALVLSLATWVVMVYEYWLSLHFLGLDLDLAETMVALTAARFAFLLPLPGGLGVLEASQVLALQALGYGAAFGISLSLLIRLRDISLGLVGLWLAGALPARGSRQEPSGLNMRPRRSKG